VPTSSSSSRSDSNASSSSGGTGSGRASPVAVIDGNVATAAPGSSNGIGAVGHSSNGVTDMDVELHASASK
jgi:hypothetical protein